MPSLGKCTCCRMKKELSQFTVNVPDRNDRDVVKMYSTCAGCRKDRKGRHAEHKTDKVNCECGKTVLRRTLKRHRETTVHELLMQARDVKRPRPVEAQPARETPAKPPSSRILFERAPPVRGAANIGGGAAGETARLHPIPEQESDDYYYASMKSAAASIRTRADSTHAPLTADTMSRYGLDPKLLEMGRRVSSALGNAR